MIPARYGGRWPCIDHYQVKLLSGLIHHRITVRWLSAKQHRLHVRADFLVKHLNFSGCLTPMGRTQTGTVMRWLPVMIFFPFTQIFGAILVSYIVPAHDFVAGHAAQIL